ncbi:MAG: hypothetical protein HYY78_02635 [Betaproteobacteria bacterium]|nr:hypothetical protein [Betaproteobacteria bacterium]
MKVIMPRHPGAALGHLRRRRDGDKLGFGDDERAALAPRGAVSALSAFKAVEESFRATPPIATKKRHGRDDARM